MKDSTHSKIIDIGLQSKGHFIALNTDDTGRVLTLDANNVGLKVVWEFADSVSVCPESYLPHCQDDDFRQSLIDTQSLYILVGLTKLVCLTLDAFSGRSSWV
jgi:hypothetical protein